MPENVSFSEWTADRRLHSIGTNFGSDVLPFQGWQKFKEAFAPELILRAIDESSRQVHTLLDPFGGSGTSALAAQFAGVSPITAEVNPYLCDLIEAKLSTYNVQTLERDVADMVRRIERLVRPDSHNSSFQQWLPSTFVEPGVNGRWIFSSSLAGYISAVLSASNDVEDETNRRLIRVVIGGTLVGLSNVRVSGKGRRYRSNWNSREKTAADASAVFCEALRAAVSDVIAYGSRPNPSYRLLRGDARETLNSVSDIDLAVFSPPYPNSFDYTDVYNVELWILGYLANMDENRELRASTLSSHVQIKREVQAKPKGSKLLDGTIEELSENRAAMWNRNIPEMVTGYFADMTSILSGVRNCLNPDGELWMVVGDSRYAGIDVPVGDILGELAAANSFDILKCEPFRSMRSSPQQGGRRELAESLVVLRRD